MVTEWFVFDKPEVGNYNQEYKNSLLQIFSY